MDESPMQANPAHAAPMVCTVLPTYNEGDNIEPLIRGVLAHALTPHMVLVVDDDSPDGTWQVVERLMGELNRGGEVRVALLRRRHERGLTSAIQRGIDTAIHTFGAGIVTWMDCDLSMPPASVPDLVRAIVEDGADLVAGSRWVPGGADIAHGLMARSLSWIINRFAMLLLGAQVHDYTSGFISGRAAVFERIRLRGDYGEYCIDLLVRARRAGFAVSEVAYVCVPRTAGDSKTGANLWDYLVKGRKYAATILRLAVQRY